MDHLPLVILNEAVGLGLIHEVAQLRLGGERTLAIALARRKCVAHQDQQGCQRAQDLGQELRGAGRDEGDAIRMLAAEGPRGDAECDVRDHDHHGHRDHQGEGDRPVLGEPEEAEADGRHQDGCGHGRSGGEEEQHVDVARPVLDHVDELLNLCALAPEFLCVAASHAAKRGFRADEQAGDPDEDDG